MDARRRTDPLPQAETPVHETRASRHPRLRGRLPHHRPVPTGSSLPGGSGPRLLRRIHRWTGLAAAIFLLLLAVTGVLVNHAHDWGLDRSPVGWQWLHDWYGIPAPEPPVGVQVADQLLVWSAGALLVEGHQHSLERLVGAAQADALLMAASADELLLLTPQGELVERIGPAALPGRIARVGEVNGAVAIDTDAGIFISTSDFLGWQPASTDATWSRPGQVPADLAQHLPAATTPGLTWSRVAQDLHSGSFFGLGGRLLNDLAAAALIFLLASGLVTWRRSGRRR